MKKRVKKVRAGTSENLESDLASAFEWIARSAIDAGIDAGSFLRAARIGLVRAGNDAVLAKSSRASASASRIAALTGLTRKEIPELLAKAGDATALQHSPLWKIVRKWNQCPEFLESSGKPREIPIEGGEGSLRSLVAMVAADIPHISVLKELEASGLISRQSSDKIRLTKKSGYLLGEKEKNLEKLSRRIRRMSQSAYAVVNDPAEGMINEEVLLESVPKSLVALFLKDFLERSKALLDAVPKWASAHVKDTKVADSGENVGLGVYLIREKSSSLFDANSPSDSKRPKRRAKRA